MIRKFALLCGVVFLASVAAVAQDRIVSFAPPSPSTPAAVPQYFSSSELPNWQLAVGYQYNHIRLPGSTGFNTSGFNTSVTRFFNDWFGLEGQVGLGFGNTGSSTVVKNLDAKSVFAGGGPHLAHRTGRIEPWVHVLVGMEHLRFTQTSLALGSNTALGYAAGGGVDFRLNTHASFRVEGDYLGMRFFSANQSNYQVIGGIVFNF